MYRLRVILLCFLRTAISLALSSPGGGGNGVDLSPNIRLLTSACEHENSESLTLSLSLRFSSMCLAHRTLSFLVRWGVFGVVGSPHHLKTSPRAFARHAQGKRGTCRMQSAVLESAVLESAGESVRMLNARVCLGNMCLKRTCNTQVE